MTTSAPRSCALQSGWTRTVLLVLALSWPHSASSEGVLTGVVVLNREHGSPVAGVEISARGANLVTTGNDGRFALGFGKGWHPGQDVVPLPSAAPVTCSPTSKR